MLMLWPVAGLVILTGISVWNAKSSDEPSEKVYLTRGYEYLCIIQNKTSIYNVALDAGHEIS